MSGSQLYKSNVIAMNQWMYNTAQDLDQRIVERLRRFPREPDMLSYGIRSMAALGIRAWLRLYRGLEVIGREHLPREGSFVMIANHTSHLDTLAMLSVIPLNRIHSTFPAAAADHFFTSVPRSLVAAVLINALPFDRQAHPQQSLNLCKALLAHSGNTLIIFPEGTRSTTGEIGPFKRGIGLLLAGTDVPVLPCYITGAFEAWPKGRRLPRSGRIRLRIGAPRNYAALRPGKETALQICQELRHAVLKLATLNCANVDTDEHIDNV
jgi:1-acyl-sn-glycerol-3-phosphate acyltransferase